MIYADSYSSPFAHEGSSVSGVMLNVCLALVPCTLLGLYLFSWPAIFLFCSTCLSAVVTELLCLYWMKQRWTRILDGSALLTGWLLAITLPPWAPWWLGVLGASFAITIGKQLYGGIGQNIFNPAMLARTALLITFPLQMTQWVLPTPFGSEFAPSFLQGLHTTFMSAPIADGLTGATSLGHLKTGLMQNMPVPEILNGSFSIVRSTLGFSAGSMGETSELLVLLGGGYLLWRKIIRWEIPVSLLATLFLCSLIFNIKNANDYAGPLFQLSSGGVMLGAFFIATDPISSPVSRMAKFIFGVGCGLVIFIIRYWGGFPEAVAFSILFMNAFTPLLDRYFRPRIYGRLPNGKPLSQLAIISVSSKKR